MTDADESERNTSSQLARALFASGLVILAIHNLTDLDDHIIYTEAKGIPKADRLVPATTGLFLDESLGTGFWKFPRLASASIVAFFAGVTSTMHNFWAVGDDARDEELTSFPQNLTLFDVALAFFKRASDE